ncbi:MAG: YraN family protein [Candidatus Kerfeldbacteria bacterium]
MTTYRTQIGKQGEGIAAAYLQQQGFTICARNIYTRWGEIDILATKGTDLHIIEVKTRTGMKFGGAVCALTYKKFIRMKRTFSAALQAGEQAVCNAKKSTRNTHFSFIAVTIQGENETITPYWDISLQDFG